MSVTSSGIPAVAVAGRLADFFSFSRRLYDVIFAIVVIIVGAFVGNYVQQNKDEVKEKIKNFIDRL